MSTTIATPSVWLNPAQAAERIGMHPVTLAHWRRGGRGPKFQKLGTSRTSRIRYHIKDVDSWMRSNKVNAA